MNFNEKFERIVRRNNSLLCVGLDVDKEKMPKYLFEKSQDPFFDFNKSIIDLTKDLVCSYKMNMAFYEILGTQGYELLKKTVNYIPKDIVVILDGKRNDIGNTACMYARSSFVSLNADAVTVNPYLGKDSIEPFLDFKDKCSFILCRTSNPSAVDFQDLIVQKVPFYQHIAIKIKEWNKLGICGAVVGATYPDELKIIRNLLGENIPILIPGIGAQGGNIEKTVKYGTNKNGEMAIIVSSRGIIYSSINEDFSEKARDSAQNLRNEINKYR